MEELEHTSIILQVKNDVHVVWLMYFLYFRTNTSEGWTVYTLPGRVV